MTRLFFAFALLAAMLCPALAQETNADGSPAYNPYADFVVSDDLSELPAPVRDLREKLLAAAKSGDVEALGPIFAAQKVPPTISYGGATDPVEYFKANSENGDGRSVLALLEKILEAPYAVIGLSSKDRSYVWPFIFIVPDLTNLPPDQQASFDTLATPERQQSMVENGGWLSWRVFIGKDGDLQAFVAGD